MEAQILEIHENVVKIETELGCFYGTWCSSTPPMYKKYVLEIDCDEVLTIDKIELSNFHTSFIKSMNGTLCFNGLVEDIQNNVMSLRLQKSVIMIEVSSEDMFHVFINQFVCIYLNTIDLYDIEIG